MASKSVIIIGAGIAGLSAGCYAQMNGYTSRIFEMHDKPGGLPGNARDIPLMAASTGWLVRHRVIRFIASGRNLELSKDGK